MKPLVIIKSAIQVHSDLIIYHIVKVEVISIHNINKKSVLIDEEF